MAFKTSIINFIFIQNKEAISGPSLVDRKWWCTDAPNFTSSLFAISDHLDDGKPEHREEVGSRFDGFFRPLSYKFVARCLDYGMSDGKAATARQFDSLPQNMSWIRLQGLCDFVWSFWLIFSLLRETFPNWWPLCLCEVCGCKARKCNWLRRLGTKKHRDGVENDKMVGEIWVARARGQEGEVETVALTLKQL